MQRLCSKDMKISFSACAKEFHLRSYATCWCIAIPTPAAPGLRPDPKSKKAVTSKLVLQAKNKNKLNKQQKERGDEEKEMIKALKSSSSIAAKRTSDEAPPALL